MILLLVGALLVTPVAVVVAETLTHDASSGVTYQTNSGLEVSLTDDREISAVPFDDDNTFKNGSVTVSASGSSQIAIGDDTFDGETATVKDIDATSNEITIERNETPTISVASSANSIEWGEFGLEDGETDLSYEAPNTFETTITTDFDDGQGVKAVDSSGETLDSGTIDEDGQISFSLPSGSQDVRLQESASTLTLKDIETQETINDSATAEVQFFGEDETVEIRETENGVIDMSGLPLNERFSVSVDAGSNYTQRQAIIPSVTDQETIWLLPSDGVDSVEPRFTLSDSSDQFDEQDSEIVISRPIEIDGETKYRAVAGDRVGLQGFDTVLERGQRYRLEVRDPSGTTRQLGEFTPTQSENVDLEIQDVEFDSESDVDGLEWSTEYESNEDADDTITFNYYDDFGTDTLNVTIHERGNESNVLLDDTFIGNVTLTEPVPENSTVWTVEWDASRGDGETLSASRQVSASRLPVNTPGLDSRWQNIGAMLSLFIVGGLFSRANAQVGAISVASLGGMFWMIGWLPSTTTGLMVAVALLIAVLSYVAQRKSGVVG